ncbi:MAG: ferritin-like domain-containing protein, partial [Ilumatobacteraceae bacterium]
MRFDIDDHGQRADRLRWDDLDLTAFAADPLDDESRRAIEYMHDVEHHTICYLRDLLVTPVHADPDVTTFLSCWAFEELWHGEALGEVLTAHGRPAGSARIGTLRQRLGRRDRLRPYLSAAGSTLVGDRVVALHMTWGAVNEWTTQGGYARLAQRAHHPVLGELVKRIARQEGRHIDFYASEASRRLAESKGARRLVR